ncbi:unnamed protein product [Cylindrotheca closterium]|uniref:DUF6824 domain-containing protein n=1 Tax=Cylindrotheca closterium TaxID=2856 RepID=A0AAD2G4X2_9STRA|nr:unnamed protein product [Cylindrotheca closterium]
MLDNSLWDNFLWDDYFLTQADLTDTDSTPDEDEDESKRAQVFSGPVPHNASDPENADSLIASQMAKLSVADREKVYNDVHGIPDDCVEETSELIHNSLWGLQHEIDILPDKKAYNIAERLNPKYTQDRDFRLAFLRCEKFDCHKAALRFVRHFQMKLDLFGQDMLTKDITQDDLDVDDMECLYLSNGRFLNTHDKAGRRINIIVMVHKTYRTDTCLRKGFYNFMTVYRDLEIQRRGFVNVSIQFGDKIKGTSADNADLAWKLPKQNEAVPLCLSAIHLCYTTKGAWEGLLAVSKTAFSKANKVRCRVHCGPILKCLEDLRGHGIDPSCIPVNHKGEITDLVKDRKRIEQQRRQERLKYPTRSTIAVPFCEDVLLGKGTPFQIHVGNKKLQQFVADRFKKYERAQKGAKKAVAQEIIDVVRGNGGLFLKQDGNRWVPVTDDVALLKVGALFRYLRLKNGTK